MGCMACTETQCPYKGQTLPILLTLVIFVKCTSIFVLFQMNVMKFTNIMYWQKLNCEVWLYCICCSLTKVHISLKCSVYSVLHTPRSSHRIIFSHTVLSPLQLLLTMLCCCFVCLVRFRVLLLTTELKPYEDSVNVYVLVSQEILES